MDETNITAVTVTLSLSQSDLPHQSLVTVSVIVPLSRMYLVHN